MDDKNQTLIDSSQEIQYQFYSFALILSVIRYYFLRDFHIFLLLLCCLIDLGVIISSLSLNIHFLWFDVIGDFWEIRSDIFLNENRLNFCSGCLSASDWVKFKSVLHLSVLNSLLFENELLFWLYEAKLF